MVDIRFREILIIGIVVVIILSGFIVVQNFTHGSADLTITSASVEPSSFNGNSDAYTVQINLQINFTGQMTVTGYLNECSFHVGLNSSIWGAIQKICTGMIESTSYSGSQDFAISFWIEPITSFSPISTPFNLSINVFSSAFNVESQYYNLAVTNPTQSQSSMTMTNASLDKVTNQDGLTSYYINTSFYLFSNQSFNVTYGCTSPFTMKLVNSSWSLNSLDCLTVLTHYIPSGISEYSLTYLLINPNGKESGYTPSFPLYFYVQITLGNNLLKSNVYTLPIKLQG